MKTPHAKTVNNPARIVAWVCLALFISSFAVETFHEFVGNEVQVEILDPENETENENDNEKREKNGKDKYQVRHGNVDFNTTLNSQYNSFSEGKLREDTQEIDSPPPEA